MLRQGTALYNSLIRVQSKEACRCTSGAGERFDSIVAQFEVRVPTVTSRMIKSHDLAGFRIDLTHIAPLPRVAPDAGPREVFRVRGAIVLLADNVAHLMRRIRVVFVKKAVLALMTSSCRHKVANGFVDCHRISWWRRALAKIMRCSSCRKSPSSEVSSALSFSALARSRR